MASSRDRGPDTGYPQLHRDQVDMIIDALLATIRDRNLGDRLDLAEATASDLTGFYTRRWGMPPSITRRASDLATESRRR